MKVKNKVLLKKEIAQAEKRFSTWVLNTKGTHFSKTFLFKDHIDALVFIARVTVHAQILNHHPEIVFTFKKVHITVFSTEVKALTTLDIDLIKQIEMLKTGDK